MTFGRHVSPDAHWYSRLVIILPCYFWKVTSLLLYNVSAEVSCFLRFIIITILIALVTPALRICFCWSWTRTLFSELKMAAYLHVCGCSELKLAARVYGCRMKFFFHSCVFDFHILCHIKFYFLLWLQLRAYFYFYSSTKPKQFSHPPQTSRLMR